MTQTKRSWKFEHKLYIAASESWQCPILSLILGSPFTSLRVLESAAPPLHVGISFCASENCRFNCVRQTFCSPVSCWPLVPSCELGSVDSVDSAPTCGGYSKAPRPLIIFRITLEIIQQFDILFLLFL